MLKPLFVTFILSFLGCMRKWTSMGQAFCWLDLAACHLLLTLQTSTDSSEPVPWVSLGDTKARGLTLFWFGTLINSTRFYWAPTAWWAVWDHSKDVSDDPGTQELSGPSCLWSILRKRGNGLTILAWVHSAFLRPWEDLDYFDSKWVEVLDRNKINVFITLVDVWFTGIS